MPSLPSFAPPVAPDINASVEEQPDLYVVRFGDGYSQRSPKGLNPAAAIVQLSWSALTGAQRSAIIAFLQERGGYQGFRYTLPGEAAPRLWRAPRWAWQALNADTYSVAATLEQIFDPDP